MKKPILIKPKLNNQRQKLKNKQKILKKQTPNKIIESTPDIVSKEAFFLKSGKNMKEISQIRLERGVVPNSKKYALFEKKYKNKPILRIHTHNVSARQLPSAGDIAVYFMDFYSGLLSKNKNISNTSVKKEHLKNLKTEVISMITAEGKESGRVHVRLTSESVNELKKLYLGYNDITRKHIKEQIETNIDLLAKKKILDLSRKNIRLTEDQIYRLHLSATLFYLKKGLKLQMRFNALPGYKYDKSILEFKKN